MSDTEIGMLLTGAWMRLEAAVCDAAKDWPPDANEMSHVALRALKAPMVVLGAGPSLDDLVALRGRVHRAFGAPGDWGYGKPIGDALRALYEISVPPKSK
jgi:hypothetical protein